MEGLYGRLVSHHTATDLLWSAFGGRLGEERLDQAARRFRAWHRHTRTVLGPASGLRAVLDVAVAPLTALLGYTVHDATRDHDALFGELRAGPSTGPRASANVRLGLVVLPWDAALAPAWRPAVRDGLARGVDWSICGNGTRLRVIDVQRPHAARYVELDLAAAERDPAVFAVLWALCRAAAFRTISGDDEGSLFAEIVALSTRHGVSVCRSLHVGVRLALDRLTESLAAAPRTRRLQPPGTAEQSLTLIYRMLFLLFAEARRVVPVWHPLYRASYSMAALVDTLGSARPMLGLWSSLQAASRLAYRGCRFEDLVVTPFNGQLFAAARTPLGEFARVPDAVMREVLLALTTRETARGREHISYADLGVEELGAVYERVLDHASAPDQRPHTGSWELPATGLPAPRFPAHRSRSRPPAHRGNDASAPHPARASLRKNTATFYTPRPITDFLVRRTLTPLVAEARSDDILALTVLDPAMGSGAFLVAATRFLADAYERALVREQRAGPGDIADRDRAGFRRLVVQRCIYGVDLNPMAVQLAKLSLWLASLAADAPLTFLDHHLRLGDSLLGASLADAARRPAGTVRRRARISEDLSAEARGAKAEQLPLFDHQALEADLRATLPDIWRLARDEDVSPQVVARKERDLAMLQSGQTPLARWRRMLDFWCASFLAPEGLPLSAGIAAGILDDLLVGHSVVPRDVCDAWRTRAAEVAREARLFHWPLELPDVFAEPDGRLRPDAGFDAVLGNPPWDMLRADTPTTCAATRARTTRINRFVRHSAIYTPTGSAHVNAYQLFVERALQLVRRGGRIGLVVPWGLAADHGSARVRQRLLDTCRVDALVGFENSRGLFPIHRSTRFLLLSASAEGRTEQVPCRLGVVAPHELDRIPDTETGGDAGPWMHIATSLLRRVSGPRLSIPDARSAEDLRLLAHLCALAPALGSPDGWHAHFGRELHATDDRARLRPPGRGLPVIEGKQLQPFTVNLAASRASVSPDLLDTSGRYRRLTRARLAYRDVAAATNRVSLIAAMLPAMTVSTHTVVTLHDPLDLSQQHFLCAVFNSYVANAYVRLFMSSHVTTALIEQLPVPRPPETSEDYTTLVRLAGGLLADPADPDTHATLQAAVARLYRLDAALFAHILAGFPLVEERSRRDAMEAFTKL